jgi:N-dimethylarginine dimethylaminohydrolase
LLVGRGFRTNGSGIEQLRSLLSPEGVTVIPAPLPHGTGPGSCLHLMSLMSMIDERTILVDLPLLSVETVELLHEREMRLVEIDYDERRSLACNVVALGKGRLIALVQNPGTNHRLRSLGYQVVTFSGAEIGINGGGGPTCLTRPMFRCE